MHALALNATFGTLVDTHSLHVYPSNCADPRWIEKHRSDPTPIHTHSYYVSANRSMKRCTASVCPSVCLAHWLLTYEHKVVKSFRKYSAQTIHAERRWCIFDAWKVKDQGHAVTRQQHSVDTVLLIWWGVECRLVHMLMITWRVETSANDTRLWGEGSADELSTNYYSDKTRHDLSCTCGCRTVNPSEN